MSKRTTRRIHDRRTFLKGIVAAGGASALTAVSASHLTDILDDHQAAADDAATAARGYHETPHIREYYRTLRS